MSVHYGTVDTKTPTAVKIGDIWFTIDSTDVKLFGHVVQGDHVAYRTDVFGCLLQLDVVTPPEDHTDDDHRDGILP